MSDVQHRRAYLRSISQYVFIESEIKRLWSLNSFHDSRTTVSSLWSNIYICIYIYDPWYEHSRRRILSYSTAIRANKWQEIGERCVEYGEYIYIYIIHVRKKVSLLHRCCGSSMDWSGQMRNEARWDQQSQWSILYDAHLFYSIHARFSTNTFFSFFL